MQQREMKTKPQLKKKKRKNKTEAFQKWGAFFVNKQTDNFLN